MDNRKVHFEACDFCGAESLRELAEEDDVVFRWECDSCGWRCHRKYPPSLLRPKIDNIPIEKCSYIEPDVGFSM